MRTAPIALGSLTLSLVLAGCNATAESPSGFIACDLGQLHVEGDIDGTPVSLTQSTEGSGFSQFGTGEFLTSDLITDPTRAKLKIDWSPTVLDGATSNVTTALLVMPSQPTTVAFAGQTFCAGSGSQIRIPRSEENVADLQFNLTSLTGGSGCTQASPGTLRGCWRSGASAAGAN